MFSSWALVAIVAIIAGTVSSYFQNNNKKADKQDNDETLENMEHEIDRLTKRIQNLEAIAANDPDGFKAEKSSTEYGINFGETDSKSGKNAKADIDIDFDTEQQEKPQEQVSRLANQLKNKQHD